MHLRLLTGLHLLYILWRNRLVRGCPYEVSVSADFNPIYQVNMSASSNASKVLCSGEGLREGTVKQQFSINIDARRAAPGHISHYFITMLLLSENNG